MNCCCKDIKPTERRYAIIDKDNVVDLLPQAKVLDPLTDMLRKVAYQLLAQAVEAELREFLEQFKDQRTGDGKAAVVRNGYLPERQIQTELGLVSVRIPKVCSRTVEPVTFRSSLMPPYVRKSRSMEAAVPWLYLKGVSSGEMDEALKVSGWP